MSAYPIIPTLQRFRERSDSLTENSFDYFLGEFGGGFMALDYQVLILAIILDTSFQS